MVAEAITCPKCHKFTSEPRLLQCLHTCCKHCAEAELLSGAEHVAVRCPQCKALTPQRASELPPVPYVSRMRDWFVRSNGQSGRCEECSDQKGRVVSYCKECAHFICQDCQNLHGKMKVLASHIIIPARDYQRVLQCQAQSLNSSAPSCRTHALPAASYCETCDSLHCSECCDVEAEEHVTKSMEAACNERRTQLEADLASMTSHQSAVQDRMAAVNALEDKIRIQQTLIGTVLETSFAELVTKLGELKKALLYSVDLDAKAILAQLEREKGHVELKVKEMEHVSGTCERCLSYSSAHEILALARQLHLGMHECCDSIELVTKAMAPLTPLILQQPCGDAILEVCRSHIDQNHTPDLAQLVIKGEGIRYVEVGAQTQFTVHLVCASGHPCVERQAVTAEITYLRTGAVMTAEVTLCSDLGSYVVRYTPGVKGQYHVSVKLNGREAPVSPFYPVAIAPCKDYSSPLFVLSVEWAWGVACSANRLVYVTQNSHGTVQVLSKEGKQVKVLCQKGQKAGYLWYPTGIAVNKQGHMFICDGKENGRVQKLSERGHYLAMYGGLNNPCGVLLSQSGLLYVCDKKNSRVVVLDQELHLVTTLGEKKNQLVQEGNCCHLQSSNTDMKAPHAIAEDDDGLIYITDMERHCIHVYDGVSSSVVRVITKPPSVREEFSPAGVCIQGKFLYVSDIMLNTLVTLLTTGELVSMSGGFGYNTGQFYTPQSMALDIDGYLHVCDYGNSRVLIF